MQNSRSRCSVRVINRSSGAVILNEAAVAQTFFSRLVGLLTRQSLPAGQGLIINPCRAVHTVGMKFPIDVAFVDRQGRLCRILEKLKPGRFSPSVREASYVIEAPAGTFSGVGAALHDTIILEKLEGGPGSPVPTPENAVESQMSKVESLKPGGASL